MHSNIDAAVQQGIINLLGEQALAANVGQWLVQDLVAGGLDDDDLQGALLVELGEGLLQSRRSNSLRVQGSGFSELGPPKRDWFAGAIMSAL